MEMIATSFWGSRWFREVDLLALRLVVAVALLVELLPPSPPLLEAAMFGC